MDNQHTNRPTKKIDFIDEVSLADNSYIHLEDLNKNKIRLDEEYQDKLHTMAEEKMKQDRLYEERIAQLRKDEQYKQDLLGERMARMAKERAANDQELEQKIARIQQDLASRQSAYKAKMEQVRVREAEKDAKFEERINHLHREAKLKEEELQRKIDELNLEILRQEKMYQEKIAQMRRDESYKEDVLKGRAAINREWEEDHDSFQSRITALQHDRAELNKEYEEKSMLLRMELQTYEKNLLEKVNQINQERTVQLQLVQDKITQLEQEKIRQDELYRIQLEKIQQDELYREKMSRLKDDTLELDKMHERTQEQLLRERETLEASFQEDTNRSLMPSLKRMKDIEKEYEVADKHLDVRGWNLVGSSGEQIGKIDELVVDIEAMKVRYLDVHVAAMAEGEQSRHILIPVGVATIDQKQDKVIIPNLDHSIVMKCPSYNGHTVTRDYEHTLLMALSPDYDVRARNGGDFYKQESFDDTKFYEKRKKRNARII